MDIHGNILHVKHVIYCLLIYSVQIYSGKIFFSEMYDHVYKAQRIFDNCLLSNRSVTVTGSDFFCLLLFTVYQLYMETLNFNIFEGFFFECAVFFFNFSLETGAGDCLEMLNIFTLGRKIIKANKALKIIALFWTVKMIFALKKMKKH